MASTFTIGDETGRKRVLDFITNLTVDLKKPWKLTLEPLKKKKTASQNRLMWLWLDEVAGEISKESGHTSDEVHDFMKKKFLSPKRIEINGEILDRYSTKDLTVAEMTEYLNRIYIWGTSEMGMFLTFPGDQGREIR